MCTCCAFIDRISCFIPSVVCSVFKPSVLVTQDSRRIFSLSASCWSSLETALTLSPRFVVAVTAEARSRVLSGSCVASGLCAAVCCCPVHGCFAELPSAMSFATSRFAALVGIGSGVRLLYVFGDVAIGTSVIVGVDVCWLLLGIGNSGACCVCVSAVGVSCLTKLVGVGVVIGVESMMSIICLLYFSGLFVS